MKIINPNVKEITDFIGVDNFYKSVARAARICYANYNRITKLHKEGTYKCTDNWYSQEKIIAVKGKSYEVKKVNNDFVLIGENGHNAHNFNTQCFESWFFKYFENPDDKELCKRLIEKKHFSPFSHAILYLKSTYMELTADNEFIDRVLTVIYGNKYTLQYYGGEIIVNGRIIVEAIDSIEKLSIEKLDEVLNFIKSNDLEFIGDVHPYHFRSFIVDTSIGCTREMNRHHDNFYICEQSTRFCNYTKDKFDNQIAFNKPYWYDDKTLDEKVQNTWLYEMRNAEDTYIELIQNNTPTDIARGVLPLDTHTRAIYTSTIEEWQHIIDLRLKGTTGKPHGDIKIIAEKINQIINK